MSSRDNGGDYLQPSHIFNVYKEDHRHQIPLTPFLNFLYHPPPYFKYIDQPNSSYKELADNPSLSTRLVSFFIIFLLFPDAVHCEKTSFYILEYLTFWLRFMAEEAQFMTGLKIIKLGCILVLSSYCSRISSFRQSNIACRSLTACACLLA
jgi:hypothetical protein